MALSITKLHHPEGNLLPKRAIRVREPLVEAMSSVLYIPYSFRLL
jgi:hypothetical protein